MKALVKLYRKKVINGVVSETLVEPFMSDRAMAEVLPGEEFILRVWHGPCLETEVQFKVQEFDTYIAGAITIIPKKELRADAPKEACQS